jgi:ABC-type transport system substrate-binding protein
VTNFLDFHFAETNLQFGDPYPEIYEPLREASQLADPAEAAPLYEQANNAIKELIPMVPISNSAASFAAAADVQGAYAPPWGSVMFNLWDNGTDTLVFVQGAEPISLYCADETDGESLRACAQVVEALYSYDTEGNTQPQLAEECVPNEELSVWTCTLRQGVLFHDGSTFDANDVVASFMAGLDASSPLHTGNSGVFEYYDYLWNGLINAPETDG